VDRPAGGNMISHVQFCYKRLLKMFYGAIGATNTTD